MSYAQYLKRIMRQILKRYICEKINYQCYPYCPLINFGVYLVGCRSLTKTCLARDSYDWVTRYIWKI